MSGQQQWTLLAVMALLVLTVTAGEGGIAEKQGEKHRQIGSSQTVDMWMEGDLLLQYLLQGMNGNLM